MKKLLLCAALLLLPGNSLADTYVNGYFRKNGTYVQPHYRSDPDGDPSNNWTTRGNVNPYTGELGTKAYPLYQNRTNSAPYIQPPSEASPLLDSWGSQ